MSYNVLTLLDDDKVPFLGLNTDIDPSMLPDGMFQMSQNMRSEQGIIQVRTGIGDSEFAARPSVTSGTVVGFKILTLPEGSFAVMCMVDPAPAPDKVRVFVAPYTGTFGSWTEQTASSGQFGDTRILVPTQGYCQIESLHGGFGFSSTVPACVIQNGLDQPLYVPLDNLGAGARFIYDVLNPVIATSHAPRARNGGATENLKDDTPTLSAGTNPFTTTGNGEVFASGVDQGETAAFTFATKNFSNGYQMWVLYRSDRNIWGQLKVEIQTGGVAWTAIYSPDTDNDGLSIVDVPVTDGFEPEASIGVTTCGLAAFQVGGVVSDLSDVTGIRFTALEDDTEFNARFFYFMSSGKVPGLAQYSITNFSRWTEAESAPRIMALFESEMDRNDRVPSAARQFVDEDQPGYASGERINTGGYGVFTIPVVNELYYRYLVPVFTPTEAEADKAVDQCVIYRRDPGYTEYLHVHSTTSVIYSGGNWIPNNVTETFDEFEQRRFYVDNNPSEDRSLKRRSPDSFVRSIPKGLAMLNCNGRLHVGTVKSSTAQAKVGVSEIDTAHRFRDLPRRENQSFDSSSAFVISTENKQVMAMAAMTTSSLGIYSVFAATQGKVLKLEYQYEPMAVIQAEVGCASPNAFVAKDGTLYFVTPERDLMALGSSLSSLSEDRVNTILQDIPDAAMKYCSLQVWRGRVYLAHSYTGQTLNLKVLVYNQKRGYFEGDDLLPSASCPQIFACAEGFGAVKLLFADQEGSTWVYDKSGSLTDGGTAIPAQIKTKVYTGESDRTISTRRMQINAGITATGVVIATQRHHSNPNSTVSGQFTTSTTGATQKYDDNGLTPPSPVGGLSQSAAFGLSGNIPGGWRIQEIHAELSGTLAGARSG